jgi:hypothetical protein
VVAAGSAAVVARAGAAASSARPTTKGAPSAGRAAAARDRAGRITAAALLRGKKVPKKLKLKRARGGVTLSGLPKRPVKIRLVIERARGKTVRRTVTVKACA